MSSLRSILLAAVPAVLLASAASAAPIVIGDSVSSGSVKTGSNMYQAGNWGEHEPGFEGYSMAVTTGPAWAVGKTYQFGDVIGDPNIYDADSIIIDRVGTTISFTLKTKFGGTGSAGNKRSDFFIDTSGDDTPDNFNIAITLGTTNGAGTADNYTRGGLANAGLYNVGTYKTSNDMWSGTNGYYIGGLIGFCKDLPDYLDPGADGGICDAPHDAYQATPASTPINTTGWALEPPTILTSGTLVAGSMTSISVDSVTQPGWYLVKATITMPNMASMSMWDHFDILASSSDCANDALWGTVTTASVPAPGALMLIGLGLLGMGLLRRRATA